MIAIKEDRVDMPTPPEGLRCSGAPTLALPASRSLQPPQPTPPRILIADEDDSRAQHLAHMLCDRYPVWTVNDAETALVTTLADPPDAILADLALLGKQHYHWLRALKSSPSTRHIPVIVIATHAGQRTLDASLDAGADDFLVRPFSRGELFTRIATAHKRRATESYYGHPPPFRPSSPSHANSLGGIDDDPTPSSGGPKVLVVDDNIDSADSMALLLSLDGYEVRIAFEGTGALAEAAHFLPRAVLLDIGLPGMDGYEVAKRLRDLPGLQNALMIAITGYGQEDDRARSKAAGFDHHLVKPVDPEALSQLLDSLKPAC